MKTSFSTSDESLAFFLPLHNEQDNVLAVGRETLAALGGLGIEHSLVLINDGSTDDTAIRIAELEQENRGIVHVVTHKPNRGYGGALRSGLGEGLRLGHSLIGFMDGDGQFDPQDVGPLINLMLTNETDAAIGIRDGRKDRLHRRMIGRAWKMTGKMVVGCDVVDVDCGFKVFRREALAPVVPQLMSNTGGTISPELVVRMKRDGSTFSEMPVTHRKREHGVSSGAKPSVMMKSLGDLVQVRRDIQSRTATAPVRAFVATDPA